MIKTRGPFQFFPTGIYCLECRKSPILTMAKMGKDLLNPLLEGLGYSCHCLQCNIKYKATPGIKFRVLFGIIWTVLSFFCLWLCVKLMNFQLGLELLMGLFLCLLLFIPSFWLSKRLWWQFAILERIYTYEISPWEQ